MDGHHWANIRKFLEGTYKCLPNTISKAPASCLQKFLVWSSDLFTNSLQGSPFLPHALLSKLIEYALCCPSTPYNRLNNVIKQNLCIGANIIQCYYHYVGDITIHMCYIRLGFTCTNIGEMTWFIALVELICYNIRTEHWSTFPWLYWRRLHVALNCHQQDVATQSLINHISYIIFLNFDSENYNSSAVVLNIIDRQPRQLRHIDTTNEFYRLSSSKGRTQLIIVVCLMISSTFEVQN